MEEEEERYEHSEVDEWRNPEGSEREKESMEQMEENGKGGGEERVSDVGKEDEKVDPKPKKCA